MYLPLVYLLHSIEDFSDKVQGVMPVSLLAAKQMEVTGTHSVDAAKCTWCARFLPICCTARDCVSDKTQGALSVTGVLVSQLYLAPQSLFAVCCRPKEAVVAMALSCLLIAKET